MVLMGQVGYEEIEYSVVKYLQDTPISWRGETKTLAQWFAPDPLTSQGLKIIVRNWWDIEDFQTFPTIGVDVHERRREPDELSEIVIVEYQVIINGFCGVRDAAGQFDRNATERQRSLLMSLLNQLVLQTGFIMPILSLNDEVLTNATIDWVLPFFPAPNEARVSGEWRLTYWERRI